MFGLEKQDDELYFLKTGNFLLPYRGYFKSKKKLKLQLHVILDQSFKDLIEEWEKKNEQEWVRKPEDIISNDDICHSVQIMKISQPNPRIEFVKRFFVVY